MWTWSRGGGGEDDTYATVHPTCEQNLQIFVNGLFNRLAHALASHLKVPQLFHSFFLFDFCFPSSKQGTVGLHFSCSGQFAEHKTALQILKTIALRSIPSLPSPYVSLYYKDPILQHRKRRHPGSREHAWGDEGRGDWIQAPQFTGQHWGAREQHLPEA